MFSYNYHVYPSRYGENFVHSTITNIQPYVIEFGHYIQKQWTSLQKYIEGPIYDKSIEIAEQVRMNIFIVSFFRRANFFFLSIEF